jgi:hypothetical protein
MGNIFTEDKNSFDVLNIISQPVLLEISKLFALYPDQMVTLDEFVDIMKSVINEARVLQRDDFIQQLVDLFYRCKKTSSKVLKFEQFTAYLIDHEIKVSDEAA